MEAKVKISLKHCKNCTYSLIIAILLLNFQLVFAFDGFPFVQAEQERGIIQSCERFFHDLRLRRYAMERIGQQEPYKIELRKAGVSFLIDGARVGDILVLRDPETGIEENFYIRAIENRSQDILVTKLKSFLTSDGAIPSQKLRSFLLNGGEAELYVVDGISLKQRIRFFIDSTSNGAPIQSYFEKAETEGFRFVSLERILDEFKSLRPGDQIRYYRYSDLEVTDAVIVSISDEKIVLKDDRDIVLTILFEEITDEQDILSGELTLTTLVLAKPVLPPVDQPEETPEPVFIGHETHTAEEEIENDFHGLTDPNSKTSIVVLGQRIPILFQVDSASPLRTPTYRFSITFSNVDEAAEFFLELLGQYNNRYNSNEGFVRPPPYERNPHSERFSTGYIEGVYNDGTLRVVFHNGRSERGFAERLIRVLAASPYELDIQAAVYEEE